MFADVFGQVDAVVGLFFAAAKGAAWRGKATISSLCDKARADKITIYTVAFMAPSRGQNLLKTCAGTTANYFAADSMAQLVDAFKTIGKKAADRTTRLTN